MSDNENSAPDLIVQHALKPVIAEAERLRAELDAANKHLAEIAVKANKAATWAGWEESIIFEDIERIAKEQQP